MKARDPYNTDCLLLARWESKTGKHYVEVVRVVDERGHTYPRYSASGGASGTWAWGHSEREAVAEIAGRAGDYQPDSARTPMRLVYAAPGVQ